MCFTQVEGIVGYKQVRGVPYYKVHWAGYSASRDTWEPIYNLDNCDELIEEYHSRTAAGEKVRVVSISAAAWVACSFCNDLQIT